MESEIINNRATPGHVTFNRGINFIYKHYKTKPGFETLTLENVKKILRGNRAYTLHRPFKRQKVFNPTFCHKPRELIQMDLLEIAHWIDRRDGKRWQKDLSRANKGVKYLSVAIDAFTRYMCVVPMKNKEAQTVLEAVKITRALFLASRPDLIRWKRVYFDAGREYTSKIMTDYLKKENIAFSYSFSERKASIVERVLSTLQRSIYEYMTHNKTYTYIDKLDDIIKSYNAASHSFFQKELSPLEAERKENKELVLFHHSAKYSSVAKKRIKTQFKMGDIVRVRVAKKKLGNRGYHFQFSRTLFKISKINTHLPIITYDVESLETGKELRTLYPRELSLVEYKNVLVPKKVVRTRTNPDSGESESLVLFEDFEKPIWVKSSQIVNNAASV